MPKSKDKKKSKRSPEEPSEELTSHSDLIQTIRADGSYKTFKNILGTVRGKLRIEADRAEALTLHASRSSRSLAGKRQYSAKALMEASLEDLANRSRLVEIRVQVSVQISLLQEAVQKIKRYISTEYFDELSNYGTVENRRAMVDRVITAALETVSEGESLQTILDTLIKDIDQGGYQIKNCVSILELLDSSKGKIV